MHSHSWRLLATGHLHLDSQLQDLSVAEDDQHEIIRDATLSAFKLMIESALEHSIDLLLLTGSLCTKPLTLRACTIFRDGIEAILEEGIKVTWAAVDYKEVGLLQKLNCLPADISILSTKGKQQRIELDAAHFSALTTGSTKTRFGTICCELISDQQTDEAAGETSYIGITDQAIGHLPQKNSTDRTEDEKYQLIISGEAQRCRTTRHQNRLYHSPGAIQALTKDITGPCSATLIEIDSQGEIELRPLPTSVVIRERIELSVPHKITLEELLEQAERELLERLAAYSYTPARLLHLSWEIRGPHPHVMQFSSLELQELLSPLQPLDELSILHEVNLAPQLTGEEIDGNKLHEKQLGEQFLQLLGDQNSPFSETNIEALQEKLGSKTVLIKELLTGLSNKEICNRAAELGLLALQERLREAG